MVSGRPPPGGGWSTARMETADNLPPRLMAAPLLCFLSWTTGWPSKTAEPVGQLDPQPVVAQSVGVSIGGPSFIAGKLP